jgi:hypothetical protein
LYDINIVALYFWMIPAILPPPLQITIPYAGYFV